MSLYSSGLQGALITEAFINLPPQQPTTATPQPATISCYDRVCIWLHESKYRKFFELESNATMNDLNVAYQTKAFERNYTAGCCDPAGFKVVVYNRLRYIIERRFGVAETANEPKAPSADEVYTLEEVRRAYVYFGLKPTNTISELNSVIRKNASQKTTDEEFRRAFSFWGKLEEYMTLAEMEREHREKTPKPATPEVARSLFEFFGLKETATVAEVDAVMRTYNPRFDQPGFAERAAKAKKNCEELKEYIMARDDVDD